ncbi:MAG TPA: O-antigen ligase family protein [Streptosporangiaceae bacterium]|nr:O-antigen ligase family protein [Streptosporangiaceae bacterium]
MTTALERGGQNGRVHRPGPPLTETHDFPGGLPPRRLGWFQRFKRDPAWPVVLLLAGWPLMWATGLSEFAIPLVAIPMAYRMYIWRARRLRPIKTPRGFGFWILFLIVMLAGVATLSLQAPQTIGGPTSHRLASWAVRVFLYLGATVILLFTGNLTEEELPRKRLVWLLALLGIYSIFGGLAGLAAPHLHFTSPLAFVVPSSLQQNNVEIASMLHPAMTQIQTFQGRGRVQAPFTYSNGWGNDVAILLPFIFVVWLERSVHSKWVRRICSFCMAVAIIPIVLSFDRGLWIGIIATAAYVVVRTATQSLSRLIWVMGGILVIAVAIAISPLSTLISTRLSHGSSDSGRAAQAVIALEAALKSPIIGYGDTRHQQGSTNSIAVGRTAGCSDCGQQDIGSHGQVFLTLISNGFVGTFFYLAFFVSAAWRYRRDKTPYGQAGELVLLLGFIFMFAYMSVGITLALTMVAYAVLWKNEMVREDELKAAKAAEPAIGNGRGSLTSIVPA